MEAMKNIAIFFAALAFAGGGVCAIVKGAFWFLDWLRKIRGELRLYNQHADMIDQIENGSSEKW